MNPRSFGSGGTCGQETAWNYTKSSIAIISERTTAAQNPSCWAARNTTIAFAGAGAKLFTLLGNGMQTGLSCCGALTAGTAILGLMTTGNGEWNSDNPVGAALVEELTNVFGQFETLWCDELRGLEIDGYEDPCYCVVETVAKKLQELLARCEEEIPHAE